VKKKIKTKRCGRREETLGGRARIDATRERVYKVGKQNNMIFSIGRGLTRSWYIIIIIYG